MAAAVSVADKNVLAMSAAQDLKVTAAEELFTLEDLETNRDWWWAWVWTKKVGSGSTKVLLLHEVLEQIIDTSGCFEDFLPQNGIEFYYYDQPGSPTPKTERSEAMDR